MSRNYAEMSQQPIYLFRDIIPKLKNTLHKGSNGRIGIIGGSFEYTGAPYFSAISALKTGADLVHVFCPKDAAPVIKSYSPELIVHPLLDDSDAENKIALWLDRLHGLVIGPGLGKDSGIFDTVRSLINRAPNIPIVIDADGIDMFIEKIDSFQSETRPLILTPNAVEFERLLPHQSKIPSTVTLLQKGNIDIILDYNLTLNYSCNEPGTFRRCGGQGDVLSGILGIFSAWAHNNNPNNLTQIQYSAVAASALTRRCSHHAFKKYKRSMVAENLIEFIQVSFEQLFEAKNIN